LSVRLAYLAIGRPDPHLVKALRDAGHLVEATDRHGLEGGGFDALILDEPDVSPGAVREAAERAGGAFVMVVGAPLDERARAGLLRAGADACLPRPVSLIELQARLEAFARATARRPDDPASGGRLRLLPAARAAVLGALTVPLTAKEFQVLEVLAERPGEVLTPVDIVRLAWGEAADVDPALVSTYVARLRAKLERPSGTPMIRAVRGHGYRFEAP
jgi:DNA-binding response OmpR family regulator